MVVLSVHLSAAISLTARPRLLSGPAAPLVTPALVLHWHSHVLQTTNLAVISAITAGHGSGPSMDWFGLEREITAFLQVWFG